MEATERTQDAVSKIEDMLYGPEEPEEQQAAPEIEDEPEADEVEAEASDEENEEPEQQEASDEPEYAEIEIDGKLYEVPKELEGHLMRDKDYTQKTQEVSAQRKQAEAIMAQARAEQQKYEFLDSVSEEMQQAEALKAQIEQVKAYRREQIDNLDVKDLYKIDDGIKDLEGQLQELGQTLQSKQQEFQQAHEQSLKELMDKSTEVLRSRIPKWGEETQAQVRDFALKAGFTEQELNSVYDPRYVEVLYKASQYDKLQDGKGAAIKKVQDAPTIKPKARNPMPEDVKRKLNLRKKIKSQSASAKDKADLVGQAMAERFNM